MGATTFETIGYGKTAREAFKNAQVEARNDLIEDRAQDGDMYDEDDEDEDSDYGVDDGYTGTILEKDSFRELDFDGCIKQAISHFKSNQKRIKARIMASKRVSNRVKADYIAEIRMEEFDKYGPAGCINLGDNEYYFFGWAAE